MRTPLAEFWELWGRDAASAKMDGVRILGMEGSDGSGGGSRGHGRNLPIERVSERGQCRPRSNSIISPDRVSGFVEMCLTPAPADVSLFQPPLGETPVQLELSPPGSFAFRRLGVGEGHFCQLTCRRMAWSTSYLVRGCGSDFGWPVQLAKMATPSSGKACGKGAAFPDREMPIIWSLLLSPGTSL